MTGCGISSAARYSCRTTSPLAGRYFVGGGVSCPVRFVGCLVGVGRLVGRIGEKEGTGGRELLVGVGTEGIEGNKTGFGAGVFDGTGVPKRIVGALDDGDLVKEGKPEEIGVGKLVLVSAGVGELEDEPGLVGGFVPVTNCVGPAVPNAVVGTPLGAGD